jgi:signal transduction histidine kinase/predicted RNA-binding protein with RPS1 domain/DNA-binding response OmpR family regulator
MQEYKINQQVSVLVERIFPFGIFVRLKNGSQGYIRRRELDFDTDVDPTQIVREGEEITAVVFNLGGGNRIELSRRLALQDPWETFVNSHFVGNVVRGVVQTLHVHGIFVRIQAGISGFVPLEELTTVSVNKPEEIFWKGDVIEAIITRIDVERKQIGLSIKARIRQYELALSTLESLSDEPRNEALPKLFFEDKIKSNPDFTLYEKVGRILVVEDDDIVRDSLTSWLRRRGFQVLSAETVTQALEMQLALFKIFIVDINLIDDDGLRLIQYLKQENDGAKICVMSSSEILVQRADEIEAAKVTDVFPKPLDIEEIERFLLRVAENEDFPYWQIPDTSLKPNVFQYSEPRPIDRLEHALRDLTSMTRAEVGLLFQLDSKSQVFSILVQIGDKQVNPSAMYGLQQSPVNDVIQEGNLVFESQVSEKSEAKFHHLLALLHFESCIGVPVQAHGEIHHAAFFFHKDKQAFSRYHLRDAQVGSLLLSAILTEQHIQEYTRSLNPMLLSGELAASFSHDVFNKITALELGVRNLIDSEETNDRIVSERLLGVVLDLKNVVQAFQQILRVKEQTEALDINKVIERAVLLLRDITRKERIKIILELGTNLSPVTGDSTLLQQVFINIMINAIQQMTLKAEKYDHYRQRILEIRSSQNNETIKIRFKDNGPGIHRQYLDNIFTPGFSTRNGSGLGLYIAQSFINSMGGLLAVEDTVVPLGTTFLIDLPTTREEFNNG